ncbi:MAG: AAA family ATPase [Gemmataceae bacterium]
MIRIAIVDPSDSTREELRNVLLGMETVWLEAECSRYEFFADVIAQSQPDVAMISLDSDASKAQGLIAQLSRDVPELPILAISARGDGQAILQALRNGAREFLTAPVVLEELIKALDRLHRVAPVSDSRAGVTSPGRPESQVIAVLGSRGGIGCTTLAVNLGATLAQDPTSSVALVDMDLALGDADVALDLIADYTLADVVLSVDRLDMQFLKRSLSKHSSGLSLLPHPMQIDDVDLIREDHLQRLIGLLRASYTHLILDLSKGFTTNDKTALRMADVILLVAQLELSSLRNTVRLLLSLGNDEAMANKVQVLLTRVGSESDGEISLKKAEETIGKTIFWQIPNDHRAVNEARTQGVPLLQLAPRSKIQQAFVGLTRAVTGKEPPAAKEKSRGWSLFSR